MADVKSDVLIDVAKVCKLAHFELSPSEMTELQPQLEEVLRYVAKLDALDLEGVEPTLYGHSGQNVFREDVNEPGLDCETVLANAPAHIGSEIKVPKIVE